MIYMIEPEKKSEGLTSGGVKIRFVRRTGRGC